MLVVNFLSYGVLSITGFKSDAFAIGVTPLVPLPFDAKSYPLLILSVDFICLLISLSFSTSLVPGALLTTSLLDTNLPDAASACFLKTENVFF